ncbi:tRNA pseudouridine38-40 synthase [Cyclonatronum proteinivorum]|uniref:tRNA pseudouridine synthase A n=1 Tax=Cyclonatronum proteinivorum TaxID=1457365 RepID=A0A345ULZ4_9BACT|nr:tRNA pseudouridine(38-40) synthase TruA [Cyclonatronum proteinivorum]AXJ01496.1 tRNA pseudouridine38-40 synthase [Cyclonatronum proteinivorum]
MPRFRLTLAYNGSSFSGWQIQPNAPTVQAAVEKALGVALRQKVQVHGSGRTDAGVHANGQVAHFDFPRALSETERARLRKSLSGLLAPDVFVKELVPVHDSFHARFDADYRTYHYYFSDIHQPLFGQTTAFFPQLPHFDDMRRAASCIQGDLDCLSFTPFDPALPHHRCWFFESYFREADDYGRYCYVVTANRFLRNLVRSLVGTLIDVGSGKKTAEEFSALFRNPDRTKSGTTAPAKGLVLYKVGYDGHWKLP